MLKYVRPLSVFSALILACTAPISLFAEPEHGSLFDEKPSTYASVDSVLIHQSDTARSHISMPTAALKPAKKLPRVNTTVPNHDVLSPVTPATDFFGNTLSILDIKNLLNIDKFHVKTALRVHSRVQHRKMKLLDYRFADVNDDGALEIAALSQTQDNRQRKQLVFSIYDFDDELAPILRFEKYQLYDTENAHPLYQMSIESLSPGVSLCENWKVASWLIHECHDIKFNDEWLPEVLSHQTTTNEPETHATQADSFNFETATASRSYERLPEGSFMPPLRRTAEYRMIFATPNETLPPNPVDIAPRTTPSLDDEKHAPLYLASRWNNDGIYISIELRDADITPSQNCTDEQAIQLQDHLELWFDLSPSLAVSSDAPQAWLLEYEKDYQNEPYRHAIDSDIFGLAVMPNGCTIPMTPMRQTWHAMPDTRVRQTPAGYIVDLFIPASFFMFKTLKTFDRSLGIGFTARQHDIHPDAPFDSVATSQWHWPDPFTFGQIWLLPENAAWPPPFPLTWKRWLMDN